MKLFVICIQNFRNSGGQVNSDHVLVQSLTRRVALSAQHIHLSCIIFAWTLDNDAARVITRIQFNDNHWRCLSYLFWHNGRSKSDFQVIPCICNGLSFQRQGQHQSQVRKTADKLVERWTRSKRMSSKTGLLHDKTDRLCALLIHKVVEVRE